MKFPRKSIKLGLTSALVSLGLSTAAMAQDYDWPRLLVIGTPGTSSGSFASTNGWGPTLQKKPEPQYGSYPKTANQCVTNV